MLKRLTQEEAEQRFKEKGLILLDTYKKNSIKMKCVDDEGYYYYRNLNNIKKFTKNIKARVSKESPFSLQNIKHYLKLHGIEEEVVKLKWDKKFPEVVFKCKCGNEYIVTWNRITSGGKVIYLCKDCKKNIPSAKKYSYDFVKDELKKHGYTLLDNEYKGNTENLTCLNKDGYKVHVKFGYIIGNDESKKKQSVFSPKFNGENFIYNVNHYFKLHDIDCKALRYEFEEDRYADDTYTIYCQCSCGEEFVTNFSAIKCGQYRCQKCSNFKSNIELKVENWLKKKHIEYECQKKFEECKVKRCLPFDFYLPKYNCCIEVDGRQHEIVSKFGNETDEEAIENLAKRKRYDAIKTKFCKDNNIKLIRIPEHTISRRNEEYKKILYENLIKK